MRSNAKVYVMVQNDRLKVGVSTEPERRLRELRFEHGSNLELVHSSDVLSDAERVEKMVHRLLATTRLKPRQEWFSVDVDTAIEKIEEAIDIVAGVKEPPERKPAIIVRFMYEEDDQEMLQALRRVVTREDGKVPSETDIWRMGLLRLYEHEVKGRRRK